MNDPINSVYEFYMLALIAEGALVLPRNRQDRAILGFKGIDIPDH